MSLRPSIIPLDGPESELAVAGGKAVNLNRLIKAGFHVPGGFVVGTSCYWKFVQTNDLLPIIRDLSQRVTKGELASHEAASRAIRQRFARGEVPADMIESVREAYAALGVAPVAVRSSATAEDLPEASFAGQQETYLNVQGEEQLLASIKRCWSSLWTARAMAYRAGQAIPPEDVGLAVIVQEMVPADISGVMFTLNPITGQTAEVVINAAWGLGETLVAGQVNPDTVRADKNSGQIIEMVVGEKSVMTVLSPEGTKQVPVEPSRQNQRTLTEDFVAALARLGLDIEHLFGQPQDIEWAVAGDQLYVLQSRPVTAVAVSTAVGAPGNDDWPPLIDAEPLPFDLWTQFDVGERWPEPVTPLTWSTAQPMLNQNMRASDTVAVLGDPVIREIQWGKRAFGRVYFNEGALAYILTEGYGMPSSMLGSMMGGQSPATGGDGWQWRKALRRLPQFIWLTLKWEREIARFEKHFSQIDAWVDAFMARNLRSINDADLWEEVEEVWWNRLNDGIDYHTVVTSSSTNSFGMLESLMTRWLDDKSLAHSLTVGITGIIAAEIVPLLWELARRLKSLGLERVVLDQEPGAALEALRANPKATPFLESLDAFLQRHGHRCMTEAEWRYPRWIEAPEQVIESMASYLRAGDGFDPTRTHIQQSQKREQVTSQIERRLDPARRSYFRRILRRTHRLIRLRDNGQHYVVKLLLPIRHIYATLAERWSDRGWLAIPDDFYFLTISEIKTILEHPNPQTAGLDLGFMVAERRQAHEYWFDVPVPEILDAQGKPFEVPVAGQRELLQGVAASNGRAKGIARVILRPQDAANLNPGEILVTRATDPGWTPVFSVIGGLVLEIGGLLSHGAIVAREYGLPAVINVPGATRQIKDGQNITIDGGAGHVYLHE